MVRTAFLFPGQGSQSVGMGSSVAAASGAAREVMEKVDSALGGGLLDLMASGPEEELKLTRNAQPALMATSVAVVRALESALGKSLSDIADCVAGHSLGEYSAMTAVHVFDTEVSARLLRHRGEAMQRAVPVGEGAMAALLGAEIDRIESIIEGIGGVVEIANDNGAGQVVISGEAAAVREAMAAAQEAGVKRAVALPVSAPFHCRLMASAADAMAEALAGVTLYAPALPVYCNVRAEPETDPLVMRDLLVRQVTGRVRWRETLLNMASAGVSRFVEVGTGNVLTGLVKRTLSDVEAFNIETADDLEVALGKF